MLPFQSPNFFAPISSFYGEAAAAVLGLAAITCLYGRSTWPNVRLPLASLGFLGFAGLILLHIALGRVDYPQQNLLAVLYLIWATALASLAWRLREIFGLERLVTALSWFTLVGGAGQRRARSWAAMGDFVTTAAFHAAPDSRPCLC